MKKLIWIAVFAVAAGAGIWAAAQPPAFWKPLLDVIWPVEEDPLPVMQIRLQNYQIMVGAEGELSGLQTFPVTAPQIRGEGLKISQILDEGTLVRSGDVAVRFDSAEAVTKLEQNRNTVTSVNHQIDKNKDDTGTEATVLRYDLTGAEYTETFANKQIRRDEDIFSRWEIQESVMSAALASYRKLTLQEKGKLREVLSSTERGLLDIRRKKAQTEVDLAQETLSSLEVKAPVDGVVLYKRFWDKPKKGTQVWPGMPILDIASINQFKGELRVVESDAAGITEGKTLTLTIRGLPGQTFTGKVQKIGRVADQLEDRDPRKYFNCEILLDVPVEVMSRLRPGMRLQSQILAGREPAAAVVPKCSVIKKDSKFSVFVRNAAGRWDERPVTIRNSDYGFYVVDGVKEGEWICLRHPYEKQELRLPSANAPAAGGGMRRFVIIG